MRLIARAFLMVVALCFVPGGFAQASSASSGQDAEGAILALLHQQEADWNRGDIEAFATGYKDSPDILFMGVTPRHGYAAMVAGYKMRYPSRGAMGTLTFTELKVHSLDERIATTTGEFHLKRTASGGGDASGFFLLVLEKTSVGWKIVCDDTTAAPAGHP